MWAGPYGLVDSAGPDTLNMIPLKQSPSSLGPVAFFTTFCGAVDPFGPVPPGVTFIQQYAAVYADVPCGVRPVVDNRIEIEGQDKPAGAAQCLYRYLS